MMPLCIYLLFPRLHTQARHSSMWCWGMTPTWVRTRALLIGEEGCCQYALTLRPCWKKNMIQALPGMCNAGMQGDLLSLWTGVQASPSPHGLQGASLPSELKPREQPQPAELKWKWWGWSVLRGGSGRTEGILETSSSPYGRAGLVQPNDLHRPVILGEYSDSLVLKIAQ